MKKLKLLTFWFISAALCICLGNSISFAAPTVKITELQRKVNNEFKPVTLFIYNEAGVLTEMLFKEWEKDGTPFTNDQYVFERGADNKITKVMYKPQHYLAGEWITEGDIVYTPKYNNDDIVEITYNEGDDTGVVLYTWENGKVSSVERNGEKIAEFVYKKGNYMGQSTDDKGELSNGAVYQHSQKSEYSYGDNKNLYLYMPVELRLFLRFGEIDGLTMSDNNITGFTYTSTYNRTNKATKKLLYKSSTQTEDKFVYTYDTDGVVNGFTVTNNSSSSIKDYTEQNDNEDTTPISGIEVYKVISKKF